MTVTFRIAESESAFEEARLLFKEYADSLGVDLSFQNFENELRSIDKQYNKPDGAIIIAYAGFLPMGCAAIRKFDPTTAELKRMFVKKVYHGSGVGKKLLSISLETAAKLGYKTIRLDTLPDMVQAQNLYRKFGFYDIPPYRYNPIEGSIFMEKQLV